MERTVNKYSLKEYLEDWGIELVYILAGAFGGLLVVLKKANRKRPWWEKIIIIFAGMMTANYLTPLVTWLFGIPNSVHHAIAFLIGCLGMESVGLLIDYGRSFFSKYKTKKK